MPTSLRTEHHATRGTLARVGTRDDRVLPETRVASLIVTLVLIPAVVILWGLPGRTAELWAWWITPDLTPIFMGSAYGAGAYFFARVCGARRWHPASAGVLGAAVFAVLMLLVTFVHWDRLNHGDGPLLAAVAFYGWVGVYLIAPALAGVPWLRNQRTDPRAPAPGEPLVPLAVRRGARAFAAGALLAAAIFLLWPSIAVAAWPWELTPLTARILGCFTAQIGLSALVLSLDERWSAWRLVVQTFLVATALLLAGAVRAFGDFDQGNPLTWCYLVGLLGTALGLLALYRRLERQHTEP